jgi:isopentenyl-diphosphate Delta-isomerase
MEEEFDIVDENNVLTGERRLRAEAHSLGLWHRTVHVYFFKRIGDRLNFVVHLRSKTKDLHPNVWDTRFGGHVRAGEGIEETVIEEVRQETGLVVTVPQLIQGEVYKKDKSPLNREFASVYYYPFSGDLSELHSDDGEVQEVKWMALEEILDDMESHPERWSGGPKGLWEIAQVLGEKI